MKCDLGKPPKPTDTALTLNMYYTDVVNKATKAANPNLPAPPLVKGHGLAQRDFHPAGKGGDPCLGEGPCTAQAAQAIAEVQ